MFAISALLLFCEEEPEEEISFLKHLLRSKGRAQQSQERECVFKPV
jgi:hypothetical protein